MTGVEGVEVTDKFEGGSLFRLGVGQEVDGGRVQWRIVPESLHALAGRTIWDQ